MRREGKEDNTSNMSQVLKLSQLDLLDSHDITLLNGNMQALAIVDHLN